MSEKNLLERLVIETRTFKRNEDFQVERRRGYCASKLFEIGAG